MPGTLDEPAERGRRNRAALFLHLCGSNCLRADVAGEFAFGDGQGFVGDGDHAVDLVLCDRQRRGEVHHRPDAGKETALFEQLGDAVGELVAAPPGLLRFLVRDELDRLQHADATHVAGFQTWKDLGRYVKKGEKGIAILAPMMLRKCEEASEAKDDHQVATILRFKVVHVFDVTQTDGEPLPEFARRTGAPGPAVERLRSFLVTRGIELVYEQPPMGALGSSSGGRIRVKPGLTAAEEFGVLVHETAHELLHHGEGSVRGTLTSRETEAEAVTFVVAEAVGLQNGTASSDYIQLYRGDVSNGSSSLGAPWPATTCSAAWCRRTACSVCAASRTASATTS